MKKVHLPPMIACWLFALWGVLGAQDPGHLNVYEATLECGGEPMLVVVSPLGMIAVVDRGEGVSFYSSDLVPIGTLPPRPRLRSSQRTFPVTGEPISLSRLDELRMETSSEDQSWHVITFPDEHQVEVSGDGIDPFRIGAFGARTGLFSRPQGVDIHGDQLFVADTSNHRIQVFTKSGVPLYRFGMHQLEPRQGEGRLHYPVSVTVARDGGRAFVAEPIEGRVQVFRARLPSDPPLTPAATWERADLPAHCGEHWAVNEEWLLISEPDAERISLYKIREGREPVRVSELGGIPGDRLGQFRNPGAIDVLPAGELRHPRFVVHDRGNQRWQVVEVLEQAGTLKFDRRILRVVSSVALPKVFFTEEWIVPATATTLSTDREGFVFVANLLQRVERRSLHGGVNESWNLTSPASLLCAGQVSVFCVVDGQRRRSPRQQFIHIPEEGPSLVSPPISLLGIDPAGIAQTPLGYVVVDRSAHRLVMLDPSGEFLHFIGSPGTGAGQFHHPRAVSVDQKNRIWVLDHGNHRGQVLDPEGNFLWAFGSKAYVKPILDAQAAARDPEAGKASSPVAPRRGEEE